MRVGVARTLTGRLTLYGRSGGALRPLRGVRIAALRRGARTVVIGLTAAGRRYVLGCRPPRELVVSARTKGERSAPASA